MALKTDDNLILDLYNKYYLKGMFPRQIEKLDDCPYSDTTLERGFKRLGLTTRNKGQAQRKYKVDESYFEEINTSEKAWLLGFIAADGCNNTNKTTSTLTINLAEQDIEILYKIKDLLKSEHPIKIYESKGNRQRSVSLVIGSQKICFDLNKLGIVPNKTLTYSFPEFLDPKLYKHFIRGYFDGDGSIWLTKKHKRMSFSIVGNYWFNDKLSEIFKQDFNINTTRYFRHKDKGNTTTQQLYVAGNIQITKLMNWMYEDSTIHLRRKYDKFQKYMNYIYVENETKDYSLRQK